MLGRISSRVDSRGSVLPPSLNDSPLDFLELKMTEFEYFCLKNCKGGGQDRPADTANFTQAKKGT